MKSLDPAHPAAVDSRSRVGVGHQVQVDGRVERGARTRRAIIEAYIDLIREGEPHPRVERIAERAGAGTRTVYNQFQDLEGLRAEVWAQLGSEFEYVLGEVVPDAPLEQRIGQLIDARSRWYEVLTPFARAADGLHKQSAELRRQRAELVDGGKRELRLMFASELASRSGRDRTRLLAALAAATSWHAWISLREELELDVREAGAVIAVTVRALLGG